MNEQLQNTANLNTAATEAAKPFEDLADAYISANAALQGETPEEFSDSLAQSRLLPEVQVSATETEWMKTLDNVGEIRDEAITSNSPDFSPQPWQQDFLAAVEAKTKRAEATEDMDYSWEAQSLTGREKITGILHAMSKERFGQAKEATDPNEKARLNQEYRELSRFVSLRDAAHTGDDWYAGAANSYYETCKASDGADRSGLQEVTDQIDYDTFFVKYMPEALAKFKADEHVQAVAEAAAQPREADFLPPEEVAAAKEVLEHVSVGTQRQSPASSPENAEIETEHDRALREKAAKILQEARTPEEWGELNGRLLGENGLNVKIQEERRRGIADGPATQESRKIKEIGKSNQFTARNPEDIPKMFELLGMNDPVMKQKAEKFAQDLREGLQAPRAGFITSITINFSKNKQTGKLEPGLGMLSGTRDDRYIDEM